MKHFIDEKPGKATLFDYLIIFFPGKCVLLRDPSFHGCGFRMIEKENYDTPIVIEVRQNSPAKRRYNTQVLINI